MTFQDFKTKFEHVPVELYPNHVAKNPLVSVCVITYQHADYIRNCLDGILMQKTNFPFEILIGEDCSTDGTREICIEYAKKYPSKIRLILHHRENVIKVNGFADGKFNFLYVLGSAIGKYLAICEGDDFWTDSSKLQRQVDILEANSKLAMCTHETHHNIDDLFKQFQFDNVFSIFYRKLRRSTSIFYRDIQLYGLKSMPSLIKDFIFDQKNFQFRKRTADAHKRKEISYLEDLSKGTWYMHFCTIVARRNVIIKFFDCYFSSGGGHQLTLLIGAMSGGIYHIPKIMAVKNDQPTSITRNSDRRKEIIIRESNVSTSGQIKRYESLMPYANNSQKIILKKMIADYAKKIEMRTKP